MIDVHCPFTCPITHFPLRFSRSCKLPPCWLYVDTLASTPLNTPSFSTDDTWPPTILSSSSDGNTGSTCRLHPHSCFHFSGSPRNPLSAVAPACDPLELPLELTLRLYYRLSPNGRNVVKVDP
jgi:hypothetical protein